MFLCNDPVTPALTPAVTGDDSHSFSRYCSSMICLCLSGETLTAWDESVRANRSWINMVELRVDLLKPAERSPRAIAAWRTRCAADLPVLLTIRRVRDLGRWEGDDAQRAFLLRDLIETLHPDYVDIELDRRGEPVWDQLALQVRSHGGTVLRSHHEVQGTPEEISSRMALLAREVREMPMLTVKIRTAADLATLVNAADEFSRRMPRRDAVWVGTGETGLISRVFPARFHSAWTYATDVPDGAAAPGQVDARTLRELYRVGDASREWPLFAVIGAPVAHSRSPNYHNSRFIADGHQALYVPLRIDSFDEFGTLADALHLRGVSVTVPHKEAALALARREGEGGVSAAAADAGAANTLVRTADQRWEADNTDVAAFLAPIAELIGRGEPMRAAVIGAGGAARAVVAGLVEQGVTPEVFNRTEERARRLVAALHLSGDHTHQLSELEQWTGEPFDLIVQTTSVGMEGDLEQLDPIPGYRFSGAETVYDIVYTPPETPLLARARAAGCTTISGGAMFEHQADRQYNLFVEALSDPGEASR
jgi:3-dehydroquinate dehydratase / shikimate dehydrogenase